MQNAALHACGLNYVYVPFDVDPEGLGAAVAGLRALGVAGFNVTIPHKTSIMKYLDELDASAEAAGAVNTVKYDCGRLVGYNTDGDGLVRSLTNEFGFNLRGASIAIAGAGGAARGAVASLCRAGAGRIVIANRTAARASELATILEPRFPDTELVVVAGFKELEGCLANVDVLVNTTSLGMNRDTIPNLRLTHLSRSAMVYDMVYAPPVTPLLQEAAGMGLKGANGLGMLAAQGELAFTIWTGITPPSGLMKGVIDGICDC
jgi:shikimate dehydrogenase